MSARRLVGLWAGLAFCVIACFLWISSNIFPDSQVLVALKLVAIVAVFGVALTGSILAMERKWFATTGKLQNYVSALPSAELDLPDGPPEFQSLLNALREMADRSRHLTDRASREVARREAILACMAEGVLAVDRNLKVIFCNEAFGQAFSTRIPAAEGRALFEVVREPALRDILERVLRSGIAETETFQLPSAAGRWFIARAVPLGEEREGSAVIVLHDITDIERQEQVRKDFVANVSHELRTPLAAIRGYAETLLDGALEDSENNRKFVEIILAHAVRLNNIASDLLVISELDSNVQPGVRAERLSVLQIIESAVHSVENAAALRGIRLNRENCHACTVTGYRFRLEQALVNLLDNAVKFNRADGSVTIECVQTNDRNVRISISDTGIGIAQDDLRRVFDRFYRVDKARSRATGGTGLGLSIVREVVDSMNGSIAVDSQLGNGSRFTILLPAVE